MKRIKETQRQKTEWLNSHRATEEEERELDTELNGVKSTMLCNFPAPKYSTNYDMIFNEEIFK